MKNFLIVLTICVAMIAIQVEMRTMNDRFRIPIQSLPTCINYYIWPGATLNNYVAYIFGNQNGIVVRNEKRILEGVKPAPPQIQRPRYTSTIPPATSRPSSIPVHPQPTEREYTTTTSSSISSSKSDSDAMTTERGITFPPSGIRSPSPTGSDSLVDTERPTEPAHTSTLFNDTSSTTMSPSQLPLLPQQNETNSAATTTRSSYPSSDSTTDRQLDETDGVSNSSGTRKPGLPSVDQSMIDLKPEYIQIISSLARTRSPMDLDPLMITSPSTETEATSSFPPSAFPNTPASDIITSKPRSVTTTRSSDSPTTVSPTKPGSRWNQSQGAQPDKGMIDPRASPTSDQPLANCVPKGSVTELVMSMLAQAIMPETSDVYSLPDEYQVLQVSRSVDSEIKLHITLKLANGVCDVIDLRADGKSGKRRGTQFRQTWCIAGVRRVRCPSEEQSTVPYCREGSF